jgi:hypothetical protein
MDAIAKSLNQAFINEKVNILHAIAEDYGLDVEELLAKYVTNDKSVAKYAKMKKSYAKKKKSDYVEAEEYIYNNVTYLVDGRNQVYTYDLEKPTVIGEKLIDGSVKFFEGYMQMTPR